MLKKYMNEDALRSRLASLANDFGLLKPERVGVAAATRLMDIRKVIKEIQRIDPNALNRQFLWFYGLKLDETGYPVYLTPADIVKPKNRSRKVEVSAKR